MSSGRIHDRVTLWSLPWVVGLTLWWTRSGHFAVIVAGGYLFSGLMFGPDLDIRSRQYQRWGWLRWLWLPYQKSLRHRSHLSHGLLLGTALRLAYLLGWGVLLTGGIIALIELISPQPPDWGQGLQALAAGLVRYRDEAIALFLGLEGGAMSHSLTDWLSSAYKRAVRRSRRPR